MRVAWTVALLVAMTLACGEPKAEFVVDGGTGVTVVDAGVEIVDSGSATDAGVVETGFTESEQLLINLPADSWYRVPKGYIEKCDDTFTLPWHAIMGCVGLVSAWNSGVWDPLNRQMLLWGGGHADYAGNELYAFRTRDFTWSRLTEPSLGPYNRDPLDDGKPVSRHTYDGLTWDDNKNVMLAWGGSRSMDGGGTDVTWTFDPTSKVWANQQPSGSVPRASYDHTLVYDPASKTAFLKKTQGFFAYDTVANKWSSIANFGLAPYWPRYAAGSPRGTIDTKRQLLWVLGGRLYMVYDILNKKFVTDEWITTGGGTFTNAQDGSLSQFPDQHIVTGGGDVIVPAAPALDYDSKADSLVAWVGGGPYVLNFDSKTWIAKSSQGAPEKPLTHGTFGRFRYIKKYNVFILINGSKDVYFYKHTAGGEVP